MTADGIIIIRRADRTWAGRRRSDGRFVAHLVTSCPGINIHHDPIDFFEPFCFDLAKCLVFEDREAKVAFTGGNELVEALGLERKHEAFRDRIQIWASGTTGRLAAR